MHTSGPFHNKYTESVHKMLSIACGGTFMLFFLQAYIASGPTVIYNFHQFQSHMEYKHQSNMKMEMTIILMIKQTPNGLIKRITKMKHELRFDLT